MERERSVLPARLVVGNDVVDLEDPRCHGMHENPRFLARVFAPEERAAIARARDPGCALWLRWAAKEAAYKVVSKVMGAPPPFTHASFVVEVAGDRGFVQYGPYRIPFHVASRREPLHVIALAPELEPWPQGFGAPTLATGLAPSPESDAPTDARELDDALRERFTARELPAVHSLHSAWVRLEARAELARMLGVEERRLEIVCESGVPGRAPPLALLDGRPTNADVSLSHHGAWLGWAALVWRG